MADPAPEEDDGYYGDARERTADNYHLREFNSFEAVGEWQMPLIKKETHIPAGLIGFNYLLSSKEYTKGIHFYIDDYQFERIWNQPQEYLGKLAQFDCALTPDFSLYMDMPRAMKLWNIYRSRMIGQMMQKAGIKVIPTLSWAERETFDWCFDGIERGGVVSVSTIGVKRDPVAAEIFAAGMEEALKRIKPSAVVLYGGKTDFNFGKTQVVEIKNEVIERWKG